MNPLEDRLARIQTDLGITDPEKMALLARTALHLGALQARALAGEDVEQEMKVIEATIANLDEHTRLVLGRHLVGLATDVLGKALGVALVAP